MKRTATAAWSGGLKDGKGNISTESGVLSKTPYGFATRFENERGTNPEELIAAAHAACFTMAVSAQLGNANLKADKLETKATITLEKLDSGWTVTASHLELTAKIPGASQQVFETATKNAETGCPISKLLKAKITLDAKLEP